MTCEVNVRPDRTSYRCEALAEGFVCGSDEMARYVLGVFWTISPVLALRWLGGRALWIADRLDPDPQRSAWVRPFMLLPVAALAVDRPAELRTWYEDRESQRAAHAHIKSGNPLLVVVPDVDCAYTLSVRPV
ncbi:hypothetical protein GCM10015535_54680 [Streptomyces gelaticus]|uniref:Uncharacterized protein n=1 Tax=Streptomyces gelaticus TaxID=285446 RepID=A0ABQ2W7U5_9ACTN|nr:hypothetical protein [Streptomyces gelaticus]GGV92827.1 hypothetical protein GCM10015535_54680 [Streptomyces gelaticus]